MASCSEYKMHHRPQSSNVVILLKAAIPYDTTTCHAMPYYTIPYSTIPYSTMPYSSTAFLELCRRSIVTVTRLNAPQTAGHQDVSKEEPIMRSLRGPRRSKYPIFEVSGYKNRSIT